MTINETSPPIGRFVPSRATREQRARAVLARIAPTRRERALAAFTRMGFPIVHDPATGRFLPAGDAGGDGGSGGPSNPDNQRGAPPPGTEQPTAGGETAGGQKDTGGSGPHSGREGPSGSYPESAAGALGTPAAVDAQLDDASAPALADRLASDYFPGAQSVDATYLNDKGGEVAASETPAAVSVLVDFGPTSGTVGGVYHRSGGEANDTVEVDAADVAATEMQGHASALNEAMGRPDTPVVDYGTPGADAVPKTMPPLL